MTHTGTPPSLLPISVKRRMAFALYAAIFLEGSMLASIGPTLDGLSENSGSTTEQISILFTANALGYVAGSLLGGRLYGRIRGTAALAVALLSMALFTALIPVMGSLWLLVLVFAVVGISLGLIDVGGNTLLVWLFRREVAPYMNALHLSFGVGAFLIPLVVDRFAVATDDATTAFWLYAALMVPAALWLLRIPDPDSPGHGGDPMSGTTVLRRNAFFLGLMGVLFFMHVGAELAFGGWIFSYADELQIGGETTARVVNSVFWGGLVLGRLIAIPLSLRLSARAMLQIDLLGAGASLALIALLPDWGPSLWIGTAAFGVFIASVFASCVNYTERRIPFTGAVMSVFVVGAGIGSMTLPWLVGQFFDRRGPESMLWVVGGAIAAGVLVFGWIQVHMAGATSAAEPTPESG